MPDHGTTLYLVSEDHWLSNLYPEDITTLDDYVRCSTRLRQAMGPHVVALLRAGLSVVMDFPANTPGQRRWLRGLSDTANVHHELHFLDVPDEVCKRRLQDRNASGDHPYRTSETDFDVFARHFVPPTEDGGLNLIVHRTQDER